MQFTLREKCPNGAEYLSVFNPNAEKYGPEKTPYLDTFHAVAMWVITYSCVLLPVVHQSDCHETKSNKSNQIEVLL